MKTSNLLDAAICARVYQHLEMRKQSTAFGNIRDGLWNAAAAIPKTIGSVATALPKIGLSGLKGLVTGGGGGLAGGARDAFGDIQNSSAGMGNGLLQAGKGVATGLGNMANTFNGAPPPADSMQPGTSAIVQGPPAPPVPWINGPRPGPSIRDAVPIAAAPPDTSPSGGTMNPGPALAASNPALVNSALTAQAKPISAGAASPSAAMIARFNQQNARPGPGGPHTNPRDVFNPQSSADLAKMRQMQGVPQMAGR